MEKELFNKVYQKKKKKLNKSNSNSLIQPKMRFKPRTDLERIVDQMNSISYNKNNSKIIKSQLKRLGLKSPNLINENQIEISENESSETSEETFKAQKNKIERNNNSIIQKLSKFSGFKIKVISKEIKEIMKDYHKKTHFKGASQYIEELQLSKKNLEYKICEKKAKREEKNRLKRSQTSKEIRRINNIAQILSQKKITKKDIDAQLEKSCLSNFIEKYPVSPENSDIILSNPFLYENQFHNNNKQLQILYNDEKKSYLKKLILSPQISSSKENNRNANKKIQYIYLGKTENKNYFSGNKIYHSKEKMFKIDGEKIPAKEIEKIASRMFLKCNYIHKKNK